MKNILFDEIHYVTPSKKLFRLGKNSTIKPTKFLIKSGTGWRIYLLLFATAVSFSILLARSFFLMVLDKDHYKTLSQLNKTRKGVLLAERGVVYSSDDAILARNDPSFALEINTALCGSFCDATVARLKEYLPDLSLDLSKNPLIVTGLTSEQALKIEASLYQLPGVSVLVYPTRVYSEPEVFAHSIGYVGLDDRSLEPKIVGKSGVELQYDDQLKGISGSKIMEVDSTGKNYRVIAQQDSLPGKNVILYLNKSLSVKAYELLKKAVEEKKAIGGAVVAQDPQTGGVLALVSYPAFDANKMNSGISFADYTKLTLDPANPFFNRAISGAYPPGSTFKMITASAGLGEGKITQYTTIFDPGYISVNGFRFNNWKLDGHGEVNIIRALQVSNDTYFYTVGGGYGGVGGVGIEKLFSWARKFGYGQPLGVDISGEVKGYMPDGQSRAWYLGDTYITSIGQGDVLATPLQVNTVTSYFANGGRLMQPRIVRQISGEEAYKPQILAENLIDKKNYDIIREGLKKAVQAGGTGYPVYDFPAKHGGIELGGKTGTSEYINSQGKPSTHAWFTVFGPFKDSRAEISITVFLEGGASGADDAAPIARSLLDVWFAKNLSPKAQ